MTIRYYHNSFTKDNTISKKGSSYWTTDGMSLVRFDGMQEVKPIEFDILRKARVYVNGDFLPLNNRRINENRKEVREEYNQMRNDDPAFAECWSDDDHDFYEWCSGYRL